MHAHVCALHAARAALSLTSLPPRVARRTATFSSMRDPFCHALAVLRALVHAAAATSARCLLDGSGIARSTGARATRGVVSLLIVSLTVGGALAAAAPPG